MAKINLDKYYTPSDLAEYCVNKTKEVIGFENIIEWPEPGAGVFLPYLDNKYLAFDIEPEAENIEQDFKGRCVIGNPPFGEITNLLSKRFYDKSVQIADYIAFILPLSQYKNTRHLYKFDLLHSEKLEPILFSGVGLKCVFNIYIRPNKWLNKRRKIKLNAITIYRQDKKGYENIDDFDIRMCYWGSAGKILTDEPKYAGEYKIKINDIDNKVNIIDCLKNAEWENYIEYMTTPKIQQFHIIEYLREQIPQLV